MMRRTLRVLTTVLAIVGLIAIALTLVRDSDFIERHGEPPDAVTYSPSPSGSHKAVVATWAGGGGISPYCFDRLTVVLAEAPTGEAVSRSKAVFEAECDSFGLSKGRIRRSPEIKWESDQKLKVTFSILSTALSAATIKLRKQDASGYVAIDYEVER